MMKAQKQYTIAIVGATGLVGGTFLKELEERRFPVGEVRLLASARSEGTILPFYGCDCVVRTLTKDSFDGVDVALFSAGGAVSKEYAPIAAKAGALVIDNSSAWRMNQDVPLVVPEINLNDIKLKGIVANPNCSTIQAVIPLYALQKAFGLQDVLYSTYQSVSGSGQKGIADLKRTLSGEQPQFYPYDISKTAIPWIDVFLENGYTKEEMKMVEETRKILHEPTLPIVATCIRVPVEVGHGVMVQVTLQKEASLDDIKNAFRQQAGIVLRDDPENGIIPTSLDAAGNNAVYVGRIRKDLRNPKSVLFYCVADNIRKGAAGNAVQILEALVAKGGIV